MTTKQNRQKAEKNATKTEGQTQTKPYNKKISI